MRAIELDIRVSWYVPGEIPLVFEQLSTLRTLQTPSRQFILLLVGLLLAQVVFWLLLLLSFTFILLVGFCVTDVRLSIGEFLEADFTRVFQGSFAFSSFSRIFCCFISNSDFCPVFLPRLYSLNSRSGETQLEFAQMNGNVPLQAYLTGECFYAVRTLFPADLYPCFL